LANHPKCFLAYLCHSATISEQSHFWQGCATALVKRQLKAGCILWLHTDHPRLRPHILHIGCDTSKQTSAAHGHKNNVQLHASFLQVPEVLVQVQLLLVLVLVLLLVLLRPLMLFFGPFLMNT
jgi:hypothetical protein